MRGRGNRAAGEMKMRTVSRAEETEEGEVTKGRRAGLRSSLPSGRGNRGRVRATGLVTVREEARLQRAAVVVA